MRREAAHSTHVDHRAAWSMCRSVHVATHPVPPSFDQGRIAMAEAAPRRKITINTLMAKMRRGEQITQLAAYDYRTAVVADRLGMDILCVSDTGGMILFGHQSTVTVSFDEVMMMAKAIDRGSKYGLR